MSIPAVGLQCIVLGKQYGIDDPKVLDHVAACGYKAVECGCKDPAAFKKMLDDRGLKYGGMHVGPKMLADIGPLVKQLHALDSRDVCNSGLIEWEKQAFDDYKAAIALFNKAGRELRKEGIHLHYHNHDFEFKKVDGDKNGMDLFIEELDFSAVDFCIDVAWVTKGGEDPVKYLLKHKNETGYLHLKDFNDDGWTELGNGKVNIKGVVEILPELTGVRQVMVEQDSSKIDPLQSVKISRKYLKETCGY